MYFRAICSLRTGPSKPCFIC